MKITKIETLESATYTNMLWVQIHTDDGLVGLGETFFGPAPVAAYIHQTVAPYLLGQDPRPVERHHAVLGRGMAYRAMGAEARGLSAIDIALWDLHGQSVSLPIYECLGGPVRDRIRIYNTCAGVGYNEKAAPPGTSFAAAWGVGQYQGPYEDLQAWLAEDRAADVARSLLESGITAMKIWPFDRFADETGGQHITPKQIEQGMRPFRQIRDAVGVDMEIALELHSRWNLEPAIRIAEAMEEIKPLWYEDPIPMDNSAALAEYARRTRVPVTASETLTSIYSYRELLEKDAIGIVMVDPGWVGGISEARRVAALAQAYRRSLAPHDCTGPVVYTTGTHLCLALPNAMIQEGVRAYYHGWYQSVLTDLPHVERGTVAPPPGPGLGTRLRPEFVEGPDITRRVSEL